MFLPLLTGMGGAIPAVSGTSLPQHISPSFLGSRQNLAEGSFLSPLYPNSTSTTVNGPLDPGRDGSAGNGEGFSFSHSERDVPIHHLPEDLQEKLNLGGGGRGGVGGMQPTLEGGHEHRIQSLTGGPHGPLAGGGSVPLMASSHYEAVPPSNWRPDDEDRGDDFLGLYRR